MEQRCGEIRDAKSIYPLFLFPHPSKGRSPILTMVSLHSAPYSTPFDNWKPMEDMKDERVMGS